MRRAGTLLLLALPLGAGEGLGPRVNKALDAAAANLVERQAEDGSWQKEDKVHPLGRTALCCYALLHAGCPRDHPAVLKALRFLGLENAARARVETRSTYETGCVLLLLHALGPDYDGEIRRLCAWLVEQFDGGPKLWGYPGSNADLSNTQFAVFGLKVGEMHGYETPPEIWRALLRSVPRLQQRDGAFRYREGEIYRASMTHAALIVIKFALDATGRRQPPADLRQAIARGHAWFEKHYDVETTPWGRGHHHGYYFYYMYGLSRYAQIFGLDRIGDHDWYSEGAEALLRRQKSDGSWGSLEDTCFAILFLRKVVFTRPETRTTGPVVKPAEEAARPKPNDDVPCLRSWLVAGPYRGEQGEDDTLFVDEFNVAHAAPAAGRPAGKLKWAAYESPDDTVDLVKACGVGDWSGYYAACYLHVAEQARAILWVGSDDGCRVWLDGEEVLFGHHHDFSGDDFYRVPVEVAPGRHLLLVKVENHGYNAYLRVRLSDEAGGPLAGVSASTRRRP